MLKLFWPLLIVNLIIPGLIWQGAAYFVQNNTAIILPGAKLKAWRHKMFYIFHFFQSDTVLGIERPFFSWILNAIFSEQSSPISMPFLLPYIDARTVKFFPACWILIGQFKFQRAGRMQGIRKFKQIATAVADTAAGSKFPPKCDTAHVRRLIRSAKSDYVSRDVLP